MFSKLITLAGLVGLAAARDYTVKTNEESEMWGFSSDAANSASAVEDLAYRVAAIEDTQEIVTSGVNLAQTSMGRVDGIVAEIGNLRRDLSAGVSALESAQKSTISMDTLTDATNEIQRKLDQAVLTDKRAGVDAIPGIKVAADNVQAIHDGLKASVYGKMDALGDFIDQAVEEVYQKAVTYGTDGHIKQVCGFTPDEVDKYWDGKIHVSTANNGRVKGRRYYKVQFNIVQNGYFTSSSDELMLACMALSKHLRMKDGIERDLRPICNHYGHRNIGGLGQCIFIWESYFSHCGGGGYWEQNRACGGIKESELRMTLFWENNQHNHDRQFSHNNRENSHSWQNPYQENDQYKHTFCSGGNMNFRK